MYKSTKHNKFLYVSLEYEIAYQECIVYKVKK